MCYKCPFGERHFFSSLKFKDAECLQLSWTLLGAGDGQALRCLTQLTSVCQTTVPDGGVFSKDTIKC